MMIDTEHQRYCLCASCWLCLARSALSPRQLVAYSKHYDLTVAQRKIVARIGRQRNSSEN